jgi:hypothetical protein
MHLSATEQDYKTDKLLRDIFKRFQTSGNYIKGVRFGNGHIHDTFLVETDGKDNYILQRLNKNVFHQIPEMQENIERVTLHIRKKLQQESCSDTRKECLSFLYSHEGKTWLSDSDNDYWRTSLFIPDHRSYNSIDSPEKAFEGGRAIGKFQEMLTDLKGVPLHETIPFFHNTGRRLETLAAKIKEDPLKRAGALKDEIKFITTRSESMKIIQRLGSEGKIPLRITHNDTKFNNILLDRNDKALCLIDLDTVMPGYVHYDFGDAMRTGSCRAPEDETDPSVIYMEIGLFRAFSEGYLSETRSFLNRVEIENLAISPLVITYTQAVRFLSDYIDGDKYYKINNPLHNLQRARAQIQLVKSMEEQLHDMKEIVKDLT